MQQEYKPDFMPREITERDWHAILGYLLASIEEVRQKEDRSEKKPRNLVSFLHPHGIHTLNDYGQFDIARYYAKDLEYLCLSTGLQPTEFRDLFNSACIGRLDKTHDAEKALYDFKGLHLSEDTFHKLLENSGQPDWKHFVAHYGTIEIDAGNYSSCWVDVPKHDVDAPCRYPNRIVVNPMGRDSARIQVNQHDDLPNVSTFTVSFRTKDRDVGTPSSVTFSVPTETKEEQRFMVNRLSLALEQSLMLGVVRAQQSVQTIATEFGIQKEVSLPEPVIQEPERKGKGVSVARTILEETGVPVSRREKAHARRLQMMPDRDPQLQAAALRYWQHNFRDDLVHNAEYEKLGHGACLCIRSACLEKRPSLLLVQYAIAHYTTQHDSTKSAEQVRSDFMSQYSGGALRAL